jgi:hypothetical protein
MAESLHYGYFNDYQCFNVGVFLQERFYPNVNTKFRQVPNMRVWERPTFDFLESVTMRIEEKHGRLSVTDVTKADYDRKKEIILNKIESGPHFR